VLWRNPETILIKHRAVANLTAYTVKCFISFIPSTFIPQGKV